MSETYDCRGSRHGGNDIVSGSTYDHFTSTEARILKDIVENSCRTYKARNTKRDEQKRQEAAEKKMNAGKAMPDESIPASFDADISTPQDLETQCDHWAFDDQQGLPGFRECTEILVAFIIWGYQKSEQKLLPKKNRVYEKMLSDIKENLPINHSQTLGEFFERLIWYTGKEDHLYSQLSRRKFPKLAKKNGIWRVVFITMVNSCPPYDLENLPNPEDVRLPFRKTSHGDNIGAVRHFSGSANLHDGVCLPVPWVPRNMQNWFYHEGGNPTIPDAEKVVMELARLADGWFIQPTGGSDRVMKLLKTHGTNLYAFFHELIRATVPPDAVLPAMRWHDGFGSMIGRSFGKPVKTSFRDNLESNAIMIFEHLSASGDRHRAVIVSGEPLSGKKSLLCLIVDKMKNVDLKKVENKVLNVEGIELRTLAISIEDQSPDEFVDIIFRFYASAQPWPQREAVTLTSQQKMDEVCRMVIDTPACVLLADVDLLEYNETVRSFCASYISQFVNALVKHGHILTRLVITTGKSQGDPNRRSRSNRTERFASDNVSNQVAHFCEIIEVELAATIPLKDALSKLGLDPTMPHNAQDQHVPLLKVFMAEIGLDLANHKIKNGTYADSSLPALRRQLRSDLESEGMNLVTKTIFNRILNQKEKMVLGYIASSEDGTRLSVLQRMLTATVEWRKGSGLPIDLDDKEEASLVALLTPLSGLVDEVEVEVDPALSNDWASTPPKREKLWRIAEVTRRHLLRHWSDEDLGLFRFGLWLIAREAADQSRKMRTHLIPRGIACFARDMQMLRALIDSIDISAISPSRGIAELGAEADMTILPPLEYNKPMPDPAQVLRYALIVYRDDVETGSYHLISSPNEAAARLGVLLRVFSPGLAWMDIRVRKMPLSAESTKILWRILPSAEAADLLASIAIAAQRLPHYKHINYQFINAAVVIGQDIFEKSENKRLMGHFRLLRAQIEASLLHGRHIGSIDKYHVEDAIWSGVDSGEPKRIAPRIMLPHDDHTITGIADRLKKILEGPFACQGDASSKELLIVRGKTMAKLGEARHLEGRAVEALKCFNEARREEKRACTKDGIGTLFPVFGGRCARMLLKLNIDMAKRNLFRKNHWIFKFDDNLSLPFPPRLRGLDHRYLESAKACLAINVRRQTRGRSIDAIGNKIDQAILKVVDHDFLGALSSLDQAASMAHGATAPFEMQMELLAAWSRTLIDAAIAALIMNADDLRLAKTQVSTEMKKEDISPVAELKEDEDDIGTEEEDDIETEDAEDDIRLPLGFELQEDGRLIDQGVVLSLRRRQRLGPETQAIDIARSLIDQAHAKLNDFQRLIDIHPEDLRPSRIHLDYLRIMVNLLESRFKKPRHTIKTARDELVGLIARMKDQKCEIWLNEAEALLSGVRSSLAWYRRNAKEPPDD